MGLAPDTPFATKPALARVRAAGLPLTWVVGDTVYGRSGELRQWLDAQDLHYVLAVPRNEVLWVGPNLWEVAAIHGQLTETDWRRLSASAGSKGERGYGWQCLVLVAGCRWIMEHAFEMAKQETGLDDYEARSAYG